MSRLITVVALLSTAGLMSSCATNPGALDEVERLDVAIVDTHSFDDSSFTQGLEVEPEGTLLVGTGWEGQSRIYRSTVEGQELSSVDLDPEFFGEGLTRYEEDIWQLTWQDGVAMKRDATTLAELERISYEGEGWGLCSFDNELIMSDGTSQLRRLDPESFNERERLSVTLGGEEVVGINELECLDDSIYANVFMTTDILRIDAATGTVTAVIDASSLPNNAADDPDNVLNGIAHIPGTDRFLLSGKRWPDLYEVEIVATRQAQ
ncbi:glutaminyl-peptide cyclotransferase [Corynebacterium alimapuense]|uniref:Glutamine cyclotransferase n=1 Tax=Corynebacterium alimapuense TaxID=1576874 RepID=A0A3M8K7G7_9CORY|nr:glutaminyl-peptide cyclotransferase [Corynebacterium alimapuense]RNE48705.1 glutamine cyclotransferase [Corynebacterium alimapuense]